MVSARGHFILFVEEPLYVVEWKCLVSNAAPIRVAREINSCRFQAG